MDKGHSRKVTSRLRLRGYDYASPGTYFVTICTHHRACLFGEVVDGQILYSPAGLVMESWWYSIPRRYPGVMLDTMIVMPNHLHGLISIGEDEEDGKPAIPLPKLSAVLHWFKTKTTNDYGLGVRCYGWPPYQDNLWQSGFYEHIVRSDRSLERIRDYIEANPSQWLHDEDNLQR